MTAQTKHSIQLCDIHALRLECTQCHATVTLALGGEVRLSSFRSCPNCGTAWTTSLEGGSIESMVQAFLDGLKKLASALEFRKGVAVSLELADAVLPPLNS